MRRKLNKLVPPGYSFTRDMLVCGMVLLSLALISLMIFWVKYEDAVSDLYLLSFGRKVLNPGAMMPPIETLLKGCFFWLMPCVFAAAALAYLYAGSFLRGSRSIYVMKRVPNRWELSVRCLALPLAFLVLTILLTLLLLSLFIFIYLHFPPRECLPPFTGIDFRRIFL